MNSQGPKSNGRGRGRGIRRVDQDETPRQRIQFESTTSQDNASGRRSRAGTVISTLSSTSTRIRENQLETKKKIQELHQEIANTEEELKEATSNRRVAQHHLEGLRKLKSTEQREEEMLAMDLQIFQLSENEQKLERKIASLKKDLQSKVEILQEEEAIQNDKILEEDEQISLKSSVDEDEQQDRIHHWVDEVEKQQDLIVEPEQTQFSEPKPFPPVSPVKDNSSISDLVSALQQVLPTQQKQTVVTKSIDKELPHFSGSPEDWMTFKSEYERTTSKYCYDDSENCVRLRKYLKGNAREAVNHLLSNPRNVPKMMRQLEKRFGNPEHVISSLIEKAKQVKSPDLNRPETIIEFGVAVDALVTNIASFNLSNYMNSVQLLNELVDKLPAQLKREWIKFRESLMGSYNLETFQDWMEVECDTSYLTVKPSAAHHEDKPFEKKRRNHTFNAAAEVKSCHNCGMKNHAIVSCYKFNQLNPSEKWKVVREKGLCFKCLQKGHLASNCPKTSSCSVDSCTRSHHRLLHRLDQTDREPRRKEKSHAAPVSAQGQAPSEDPGSRSSISSAVQGIMPIIPVTVTGLRGQETVLALLDTGASFSMLESDIADRLGLTEEVKPLNFNVFGEDIRSNADSMSVSMQIQGASKNSTKYDIKDVRTITSIGLPSSPLDIVKLKMEFPYLNCVKGTGIPDKKPQMIIGYDNHRLFYPLSTLEDPDEKGPSAHLSRLGWYISGVSGGSNCFFACESCQSDCDSNLHEMMKNFFAVEEAGTKSQVTPGRSEEDHRALQLLEEKTVKIGNRWQTCLLWKEDNPVLPASKKMALGRLSLMEKKMDRDPTFASLCCEKFDDYIRKGYLVPVEDVKEKLEPSEKKWFLPWFFSYHPTKKPRLVFDAAAKAGGKSLNDFLLKGPDMLNSLPEVLMRFRSHFIALTADIREMFHQVKINPEDWPSQTLLYRGTDRSEPPKEYYMTVLFFGAASSPCSAIFAKNRNAQLFEEKYPLAVRAIVEDFYMDDYLGGAETTSDAILLQQQITEIHTSGGFEIVKWNSSSPEVLAAIPIEIQAERDQKILEKCDANLEKTLGMWWSPEEDCFQFKLNFKKIPVEVQEEKRKPTKREVVSCFRPTWIPVSAQNQGSHHYSEYLEIRNWMGRGNIQHRSRSLEELDSPT